MRGDWQPLLTPGYLLANGATGTTCQHHGHVTTCGRPICGGPVAKRGRRRVDGSWADIYQCEANPDHWMAYRKDEQMVLRLLSE